MLGLVATLALQGADPLLNALFAEPPAPLGCSVTLDVRSIDEGDEKRQVFRYDAGTDAWTYVSRDGEPPTAKQLEKFEDRREDDERVAPGGAYAEALGRGGLGWRWRSGGDGRAVYELDSLPEGTVDVEGRDVSKRMEAVYVVEASRTPALVTQTLRLKRPWSIPMVAKVRGFEVTTEFGPAPEGSGAEGHHLPVREEMVFDAHVLGNAERGVVTTTYSDWSCTPRT